MKFGSKALKSYLLLFVVGFLSALWPLRHANLTAAQMVGCATIIGLILIPFGLLIALFLVRVMGLGSSGEKNVKARMPIENTHRTDDK